MTPEELNALFDEPCWVVDDMPETVPADHAAQWLAYERHRLERPRIDAHLLRFAELIAKLGCYRTLLATADEGGSWERDPGPARLEELALGCASDQGPRTRLLVAIEPEDALIVVDGDCLHLCVHNPSEGLLELIERTATAMGLFVRRSPVG